MTLHTQIDIKQVKALLDALENQQADKAAELIDELTQLRESELVKQLTQLSQNLNQTLDGLQADTPILMHTKHDLPDVTERLQYVIDETQKASHTTLTSAETVLNLLDQVKHEAIESAHDSNAVQLIQQACSEIVNIMMAQSFQDLTGQVLNRTIYIMTDLEGSLKALIERSHYDLNDVPEKEMTHEQRLAIEAKGLGPNVTQKSKQGTLESQDDVDDLLDQLGI